MISNCQIKELVYVFRFCGCPISETEWMFCRRRCCWSWSLSENRCVRLSRIVCPEGLSSRLKRRSMFLLRVSFTWMRFYSLKIMRFLPIFRSMLDSREPVSMISVLDMCWLPLDLEMLSHQIRSLTTEDFIFWQVFSIFYKPLFSRTLLRKLSVINL